MISTSFITIAFALLCSVHTSDAFAPYRLLSSPTSSKVQSYHPTFRKSTSIYGTTKIAPSLPPIKDISYGEESRKYRRTVYSHDDWRKHRNPDRFLYYIVSFFSSGVYKNVGREVGFTTLIAAIVCLWNGLCTGFTDFDGVKHAAIFSLQYLPLLTLPLAPFTLSSPSLGLLLGMYNFLTHL
jgi:ion channel-forming bestrophin family protein